MEYENPIITILGDNPVEVIKDSVYGDAGATAYDRVGGNIDFIIITSGIVDTSIIGTYNITYTVTNEFNLIDEKTRIVNVV